MKNILATVITLALASTAAAASLTETIDRTFNVQAGARVVVSNVNGQITVNSWDQPRVRVIATKEVEGPKSELKQLLAALKVELVGRDGGVTITTRQPRNESGIASIFDALTGNSINYEVAYEITVPRNMNVEVGNTNGRIAISNVNGLMKLETTNGRIAVARCAGALNAATTNGSIEAEMLRIEAKKPMAFSTTNGRIRITLPPTAAIDVDASTTNGEIESSLPVSSKQISRNSLRGSINGGGTPLKLRTTNGSITLRTTS